MFKASAMFAIVVTSALGCKTSESKLSNDTLEAGTDKHVYCADVRRGRNGYIIEDMFLTTSGAKKIKSMALGRGDLTENGDGTANQGYIFNSNDPVEISEADRAKSAQWKAAAPFKLPVANEAASGKHVLYVMPEAFSGSSHSDFKARLKVSGASEADVQFDCNEI